MALFMIPQEYCSKDGLNPVQNITCVSTNAPRKPAPVIIQEEITRLADNVKKYEAQILAWERSMVYWKSLQNKMTAIATLPQDILLEIWLYLAEDSGESVKSFKEWLAVTQVCSYWRKLAVESHTLWRWPCVFRPILASSVIDRAGTRPLILFVDMDGISGSEETRSHAFTLASQLLHRAEVLNLKLNHTCVSEYSSAFLHALSEDQAIAKLKSLSIEDRGPPSPSINYTLDVTQLTQSAPELRRITLYNTTIPSSSPYPPVLPRLTYLEITVNTVHFNSYPRLSLAQVFSMLEFCPALKYLYLIEAFRVLTEDDEERCRAHPRPLKYSSLRELWVASSVESLKLFFQHVDYPTTTEVTLEVSSAANNEELRRSTPSFLDCLKSLLVATTNTQRMGKPIRSIRIEKSVNADNEPLYHVTFSTGSTFAHPTLAFFWPDHHVWEPFPNLPSICPLNDLKRLFWDIGSNKFDTDMWKAFGCLPRLKRIANINLEDHPAFLNVFSSFRISGDSIFEPWSTSIQEGAITGQSQSAMPELYFPNLIHLPKPTSAPTREYLARIMLVRRSWNSVLSMEAEDA